MSGALGMYKATVALLGVTAALCALAFSAIGSTVLTVLGVAVGLGVAVTCLGEACRSEDRRDATDERSDD